MPQPGRQRSAPPSGAWQTGWLVRRLALDPPAWEEADRRTRLIRTALVHFPSRAVAIAFLNDPHEALGDHPPILIAATSELGLQSTLALMTVKAPG